MAPPMALLATITTPLVWFLDMSGRALLVLLRQSRVSAEEMTDEEVKLTIAEAETAGVLSSDEREMIAGVMRVADRTARALMTPRTDVEMIDLNAGPAAAQKLARETGKAILPVADGSPDAIIGVIPVRDLLVWKPAGGDLRSLVRKVPVVIDIADARQVILKLRESAANHGAGLRRIRPFRKGSSPRWTCWKGSPDPLTAPMMTNPTCWCAKMAASLSRDRCPPTNSSTAMGLRLSDDRDYETVAGLVLDALGHIPSWAKSCGCRALKSK